MIDENWQINSASISDRGLSEKRPQNEDSYLELRDSNFFAVADGVGGAQAGDVASQMAMEILGEGFINLQEGGDAEDRMKIAIEQANNAIFQMSQDLPQLSTMATTVVGLYIRGNVATIGHVGDSRLYRVDPEGNIFQETHDHSVVEEEVRAGRLTPEQAENHPSRNVISRALGADETVEIDMKTIMFDPGTTFLLCSDGVTRHISDSELEQLLFAENDTFAICQYIKDICYERGAEDNLTAVVVKISESNPVGFIDARDDLEEETIASARSSSVAAGFESDTDPQMADTLEMDENDTSLPGSEDSEDPFDEAFSFTPESAEADMHSVSISEGVDTAEIAPTAEAVAKAEDIKTFRVDEKDSPAATGFLTYLPWVLLLCSLLFIAFYMFSGPAQTDNINQLEPAPPNLDQQSFETTRRTVDDNPAQAVTAISTNPADASEYYLLGRAYFLQGNYESAKTNLEKAKSLMNEKVPEANKKVLEHEISMLLAIINTENAAKNYETEVGSVYQTGDANSNSQENQK
ncbi:MAG: protein phosphatase 2C domain-containing protein [Pyrinomonadaceae bacterium]